MKRWITFNEPIVITEGGYLYQNHYPAVCDAKRAALVSYHLQLASSLAVKAFKKSGRDGQIGIVLDVYKRQALSCASMKAGIRG